MLMNSPIKKSFYDPKFQTQCVNVLPGEFYATSQRDEMITTILGSCVSACIRDTKLGIGGLNHFLLASPNMDLMAPSTRYGVYAMECLINDILNKGGRRENFEIKIFGGADMMGGKVQVGKKNGEFIKKFLFDEGLRITAEDLGGASPRRIHFWPETGRVVRLMIQGNEEKTLQKIEKNYSQTLEKKEDIHGDIELFN